MMRATRTVILLAVDGFILLLFLYERNDGV
jgi:hypothetical protein